MEGLVTCREGAREAWAMVKTHYRSLKTEELAEVGPKGRKGKEIKPISEQDCRLDKLIDGLE